MMAPEIQGKPTCGESAVLHEGIRKSFASIGGGGGESLSNRELLAMKKLSAETNAKPLMGRDDNVNHRLASFWKGPALKL